MMKVKKTWVLIAFLIGCATHVNSWSVPDTGQSKYYDNSTEISYPTAGWKIMTFPDSENTSFNSNIASLFKNEDFHEVV